MLCNRSYTVGGNVNLCSHYGELYGGSLKKLNIELPYDPAMPLLGIYTKKNLFQRNAWILMFIKALFIIVKPWKQSKCPSADEWTKTIWSIYLGIYSGILLSHREWNNALCSNINGHSYRSKAKTNIRYHLHVKSKKKDTNEFICKTERDSQT